jgi:hypothetical protein
MGLPVIKGGMETTVFACFVYNHLGNFSVIQWLSPLPVIELQILTISRHFLYVTLT